MDNLTGMAIFARVVEEQSFTKAAERLGMSKSAVSKQIRRLEDRLGARLLNRTTRRLSLTDVGAAFYQRCARIVAEAEEAELAVTRMQTTPRGTLRLAVPMSFGQTYVAPLVAEFLETYTDLDVHMAHSDRFVDVIDEGFDLAIRIAKLPDSTLIAKRLSYSSVIACAAPRYLESHGRPAHPRDLADHNCLLYTYIRGAWLLEGPEGSRHTVNVTGNFTANNGDTIAEGTAAGLGIALLPTFIAGRYLAEGRLVDALPGWRGEPAPIYALYPHNRHLSAKVRLFVDYLAERYRGTPAWEVQL